MERKKKKLALAKRQIAVHRELGRRALSQFVLSAENVTGPEAGDILIH